MPTTRKLPALKLLQGKPGHRPVPEAPCIPPAIPSPPAYLSAAAVEEWNLTAPLLQGHGLLTHVDRQLFARYCTVVARIGECEEKLKVDGVTVVSPNGYLQQHPMVSIVNGLSRQLTTLSDRFGMNARARVNTSVDLQPQLDEFDAYLARGRELNPPRG